MAEARKVLEAARARAGKAELAALLSGEADGNDCYIEINSGAGGTESQDWASILLRMYARWANARDLQVEELEHQDGDTAGIKSATLLIKGENAYGYLKTEAGVHRLVRISPFDNQGRRQTSFANVQIWPVLEEVDVEINEADIRMEVFRASGAGGQHVNKTSSAVRLIHEPTGLVASSQQERSQLQNRENALKRLKTMVASRIEEERENELRSIGGKQAQVGWGSQIRSYVMQPYQMVKDVRTEIESGNIAGVLDGDLDSFMEGFLRWRRANSDS
jgi:peptide chain release factor 2